MKLLPFVLLVALSACFPLPSIAPAEAAPPIVYDAAPQALLDAIAEIGPALEPIPPFPAYAVTVRMENSLGLTANLPDGEHSFLSFTTEAQEEGTRLHASGGGPNSPAALHQVLHHLDARFARIP